MYQIKEGSIVSFRPIAGTEIYRYEVPQFGAVGTVKKLGIDTTLLMMWGVVLPIAEVEFGKESKIVYLEDINPIDDENSTHRPD